jgi:hypothetical protein
VELDGSQHDGSTTDAVRTAYLKSRGYSVLRFWNGDVLHHRDTVAEIIAAVLRDEEPPEAVRSNAVTPHPDRFAIRPLPAGERNSGRLGHGEPLPARGRPSWLS